MNKATLRRTPNHGVKDKGYDKDQGPPNNPGLKRYNMALPSELYKELQVISDQEHTSVVELIRKFIKLGLIVLRIERDPDARIIIQDSKGERELQMLI